MSSASTYPCPCCAETIQRQAVVCRFCRRSVLWDVTVTTKPPASQIASAVQKLFDGFGQGKFATYGSIRKKLEQPSHALFTRLSRLDCEQIVEIIISHGGNAVVHRTEPPSKDLQSSQSALSSKILPSLGLASLAICALLILLTRQKEPAKENSVGAQTIAKKSLFDSNSDQTENVAFEPKKSPQTESQNSLNDQVHLHIKSLVSATATLSGNGVTGSAFFIHSDGYLITNYHVTKNMPSISVQTSNGQMWAGKTFRSDSYYDLAIVKIEGKNFPTLKLGDATTIEQGETVWTIGAPHGLSFTVTRGIVSFVGRNVGGKAYIQADVAINPGNSGGPMINSHGEVIGINNFIISNSQGLNFAIPINYIFMGSSPIGKDVIQTLPDSGTMALWRSWGKNFELQAATPSSQKDTANEVLNIIQELSEIKSRFNIKKSSLEARIQELRKRLSIAQKQYGDFSETISAETNRGKELSSLAMELIREELSLTEETLSFHRQAESLLKGAREMVPHGEKLRNELSLQLEQIQRNKSQLETLKKNKLSELKIAKETNY